MCKPQWLKRLPCARDPGVWWGNWVAISTAWGLFSVNFIRSVCLRSTLLTESLFGAKWDESAFVWNDGHNTSVFSPHCFTFILMLVCITWMSVISLFPVVWSFFIRRTDLFNLLTPSRRCPICSYKYFNPKHLTESPDSCLVRKKQIGSCLLLLREPNVRIPVIITGGLVVSIIASQPKVSSLIPGWGDLLCFLCGVCMLAHFSVRVSTWCTGFRWTDDPEVANFQLDGYESNNFAYLIQFNVGLRRPYLHYWCPSSACI